jgi:hypothetical protein
MDERLRLVEDRLEILQLEGAYGHTWDAGDGAGWAALYTEDGVFTIDPVGGRPPLRVEGRAALEAFCVEFNRTTTGLHFLHTPDLRLDGDTARSWIHVQFRAFQSFDEGAGELRETIGLYEVQYLRTPEGWRMAHRRERAVGRTLQPFYPGFYPPAGG